MSGWCPSSSACGMAVVCVAAGLPQPQCVWPGLRSAQCMSVSTAVMSCTVAYRVWCCGAGECFSVLFVWWGIHCVLPPHSGGGWGHRGWWGGIVDGGWHGEGRAAVLLTPRLMSAVPSVCWRPLCRLPCGLVEWRGCGVCVVPLSCVVPVLFVVFPVFELGPAPSIV